MNQLYGKKAIAVNGILILLTLFVCFGILEASCMGNGEEHLFQRILQMPANGIAINLLTLAALLAVIRILFPRVWLSCLVMDILCGVLGIANYYVIQFHTMPLSFLVLKNFSTAMNAVSSYAITIERIPGMILCAVVCLAIVCLAVWRFVLTKRMPLKKAALLDAGLAVFAAVVLYSGYFSSAPWFPNNVMGWSWEESYKQYGYAACTVESYRMARNVVMMPENYTEAAMQDFIPEAPEAEDTQTPDIILILNESFYDLRQITDPQTDVEYLEQIKNTENLLYGYAVVPGSGGGTNNSEYELLTSNSMRLINGTPFNYMDLSGAKSIVSHLNDLGYSTLGAHSEPSLNYSRGSGYPLLGFQRCYFEDYFDDIAYLPGRWYETDASVYGNLLRWYEESPEGPRFLYLLTIQNHGEWDWSDPEFDVVHTGRDYGQYTQPVNEYLTCMYHSDQAFTILTEYFSQVDRPVILCMMGDHCPNFASAIVDSQYTGPERELRLRQVPLVIWANYPLPEMELGTMSLNYVVPTLLEIANVRLSPYYSYLLQAKELVPVLSAYGDYYDAEGNRYTYDSDDGMPCENLVDSCFLLEYHNIASGQDREWFAPYAEP